MKRPLILITNDDGVTSPALEVLANALEDLGDIWVFAPDREQSAVGHGISLHRPLRVKKLRDQWYMADGTPTDCILLATREFLDQKPDLVFSGINTGPNLGDDVTYSGTVAGAFEGMLLGIPSIAISHGGYETSNYETAGRVAATLARQVLEHGLPPDTVLNVNVPDRPYDELAGIAITRQGLRQYEDEIITREDPRGAAYYWIGGFRPDHAAIPGTDMDALDKGYVSVTPLHRNLTNIEAQDALKLRDIQL